MSGTFGRGANGVINITGNSLISPNNQSHTFNAVLPEIAFASFATNASGYGTYTLQGANGAHHHAGSSTLHTRTKVDIDYGALGVAVLKSGESVGPLIAKLPIPQAKVIGYGVTAVGEITALTVDYGGAIIAGSKGDPMPMVEFGIGELVERGAKTPVYGNTYDLMTVLREGICVGTGCR